MNDPHQQEDAAGLAEELERLVEAARRDAGEDPFGNPILKVALNLTRRIDRGELTEAALADLVERLGREAVTDRAARLRAYLGAGQDGDPFAALAGRLAEAAGGFEAYRALVERARFGAVFTAHPTFA